MSFKYEEWEEEEEERLAGEEFKLCQENSDKAIECIVLLKDTVVAAASNSQISDEAHSSMRSLLKSPIAPLPKYAGTYEDQIKSNQKLYFQYTLVIHIIKLQ